MTVEELEFVSRTMIPDCRLSLEIFRDHVWVGECVFEGGQIVALYSAQLGLSGPETDEILAAITRGIMAGKNELDWHGQQFTWRFKSPIGEFGAP